MITQYELKLMLSYNPDTGVFSWNFNRRVSNVKDQVGGNNGRGYILIGVNGRRYYAHRLAWLYVYGTFPPSFVDHINGNRSDNRIKNLRHVSNKQNLENRGINKNNTSGFKGVTKGKSSFIAQIKHNKKRVYIGSFKTASEAHEAYKQTANMLFTHAP